MHTTKHTLPNHSLLPGWRRIALSCLALGCLALGTAGATTRPAPAATAPIVLYDGAKGTRPDEQGFTYLATAGAVQTASGGATTLHTSTDKNTFAGYFSRSTPELVLDRTIGYSIRFTVQVDLEDHAGSARNSDNLDDRAGFSLIVLSSDKRGIELGFWKDRIWAQEDGATEPPLFTQAEGAPFNTQAGRIAYALAVQGDDYALSSNGTPILSGKLRDYTAFSGFPDPYKTPNLIFLGDDTSSASATISMAYVAVGPSLDRRVYVPLLTRL